MDEILKKGIQEANLDNFVKNNCFEFTDTFFPYTSGEIGPYYIQCANILRNGLDYDIAYQDIMRSIRDLKYNFDIISGGESRDWMFSFPIARKMKKAHAMIYKDGKILGAKDMQNKKVIHIADLNNEGSSVRKSWVPAIRGAGGIIEHIFFYVDRLEEGVNVVRELGLEPHAIVPLNQHAWDYLQKINAITPKAYRNLKERGITKEQRDEWAKKMLRSEEGLKTLAGLLTNPNPKEREKGEKVLTKGYLDMKQELLERLDRIPYFKVHLKLNELSDLVENYPQEL